MTPSFRFPRGFVWGVATSALQIEGGTPTDGRGESVWDRFALKPGSIVDGDAPYPACDHYRRYRADLDLMRRFGFRHYRFSVSWARVLPRGRGRPNPKGLGFYDRLVDAMLERGIAPWITLYHWELPQALEDEGGWRIRPTAEAFGAYAELVVRTLGDRVKNWISLNEIPCFIGLSYGAGRHAPGARESAAVVNQAYHHALLAHGMAVRAVRQFGGRGARIGLTHNPDVAVPVAETPEHIAASRRWFERRNRHILGPVFRGEYSAEYLAENGASSPKVEPGDLESISQPLDFLGINVYSGTFVEASRSGPRTVSLPPSFPRGDLPWLNLIPQSLYWAVRHSWELYRPASLYITENGTCYEDQLGDDGRPLPDLHRREFVRSYLIALHRAVAEKLPVRGHFLWSFLDNFEWAEGYRKRFGIVYVDFKTQRRMPKLSAHWYAEVVRRNRVV